MFLFTKYLRSIERWIDKAQAYAKEKNFDADVLMAARLAPDQYAFGRQVQAACDAAKFGAAKLAGVEPPSHPDTEKTLDELKTRLHTCLAYLETFGEADFAGSEERPCGHGAMRGKTLRGADYVREWAVPNFLFHVTHAYAILRHNGVPLVKTDFLAPLPMQG
jgi:hypothetical protein